MCSGGEVWHSWLGLPSFAGQVCLYIHVCSQLIRLISHAFVFGTTCCFAEGWQHLSAQGKQRDGLCAFSVCLSVSSSNLLNFLFGVSMMCTIWMCLCQLNPIWAPQPPCKVGHVFSFPHGMLWPGAGDGSAGIGYNPGDGNPYLQDMGRSRGKFEGDISR